MKKIMHRLIILILIFLLPQILFSQSIINIDGNFDDWANLPVLVTDPSNDEHDTDWYSDDLPAPVPRKYSDVDILEVKFTHDRENLYGYVKSRGVVGSTSRAVDGRKAGRYYFIITIDVDNNDSTGYAIQEGNYWPNSIGYDMNMEVEFYDGSFNTGHYIHHDFLTEADLDSGRYYLEKHVIRLGPGTYDNYLQWVTFPDTSFIYVVDKGPIVEGGIIEVAIAPDGHEAEMKAPMWGFFWDEHGMPIIQLGDTVDISFSLEGSGELSETAIEMGYTGNKSVWGSDTAEPIIGYYLEDFWTNVVQQPEVITESFVLEQNYPNPFNTQTTINYSLSHETNVQLIIVNLNGQIIQQLVNEFQEQGIHRVIWNGTDDNENVLSSGIYLAILKAEGHRQIKRMLFMK